MREELLIKIPRKRAEYPLLIVGCFICFAGWAFHFGFFGWQGGAIWLAVVLPIFAFFYFKSRGKYFVQVNENGIGWRKDIISKYIYIPWKYLQRVDYLEFELNFMIKETAQVVCLPTSGIEEEETAELKQYISDVVKEKIAAGEL